MARRRRKEPFMGRALVFAGLFMKVLQVIGAALSFSPFTGSMVTLVTTCLLVGGLAVLAIENMNAVGAFSLISLVGIIGGMFPSENKILGFVFLLLTFAAFVAMLLAMKRRGRTCAAGIIAVLAVLLSLHTFGVMALHIALLTAVLVLIYSTMAAALFLR